MATSSLTGKGKKRLYEVACVAWFDLLGYGSMLEKVSFDPTTKPAQQAINRLINFQEFVAKHADRYFHIQAINDGAIIFKDLSPRTHTVTFDFLDRLLKLFLTFNEFEKKNDFPGARMIISAGFRVRIEEQVIKAEQKRLKNIFKRVEEGVMPYSEAVNEAFKSRPFFAYVPQLQANFAFTKSYLVDNAGSKGGFGGPNCYIDTSLFNTYNIDWLEFEKIIDWEGMGMKVKYGKLKKYNRSKAVSQKHKEVLNAFKIAENISKQDNITNILRQSTIVKNIRKK